MKLSVPHPCILLETTNVVIETWYNLVLIVELSSYASAWIEIGKVGAQTRQTTTRFKSTMKRVLYMWLLRERRG